MKKEFLFALLFLGSIAARAYQPSLVHQHYVKWKSVLPEPYKTMELEIALDPETDDVERFEILIGGRLVTFSKEDRAKLKDLELGTMQVWEGINRNPSGAQTPDFVNDWIRIDMELGEKRKVQWKENGRTKYRLEKQKLTILIVKGAKGRIHVGR
ncbi:MAG TPA: hypothetical protein VF268_06040 [Gammaproteobacteria bacterium]